MGIDAPPMPMMAGNGPLPPGLRIDFAADRHLAAERVAVQPRALVVLRYAGQAVRRLERELFHKLYNHRG